MDEEIKTGNRNNASDRGVIRSIRKLANEITAHTVALEPSDEDAPEMPIELDAEKTFVMQGAEVKALGDGRVGGYLVRYGDAAHTDLERDFFTAETDFGDAEKSPVLYQHGMDAKFGKRRISTATITSDEFGRWAETQLNLRDEYEKFIYEMAEAGKMGWSSGTAGHLVEREPVGKAWHIKSWPLGLDASLTPTPAEPRNSVVTLKSLITPTTEPEAAEAAASAAGVIENPTLEGHEEHKMEEIDALKEQIAALESTVKSLAEPAPDGGIATKKAPAVIAERGDDWRAEMKRWFVTGQISSGMKTANPWNETTAGDGGLAAPQEFYNGVIEKVKAKSVVRRAIAMCGGETWNIDALKITIPVENDQMAIFTATDEEGAYNESETTPMVGKDVAVHKYTRMVKVTEELLEDKKFDVIGFLMRQYADAQARLENSLFLVGAGDGDPEAQGVFVGGTAGLTFDSAAAIAEAEIPELFYKLGEGYSENSVWIMRNATLGAIMANTGDAFSFLPAYAAGNPFGAVPMLWGRPVFTSDYAAAIATSAKSVVIGDFSKYALAENGGLTVSRNPYLYEANGYIGFFGRVRLGGMPLTATAFQYGTHPTA